MFCREQVGEQQETSCPKTMGNLYYPEKSILENVDNIHFSSSFFYVNTLSLFSGLENKGRLIWLINDSLALPNSIESDQQLLGLFHLLLLLLLLLLSLFTLAI